jgi:hypothetical protein
MDEQQRAGEGHHRGPLLARVTGCQADENLQATPARLTASLPLRMKLRSVALQQSRHNSSPSAKPASPSWCNRPAVIGRNADIFGGSRQQFFGKRTNQSGIDAGEFIPPLLYAENHRHTRSSPVTGLIYRDKPGLLSVRACACFRSWVSSA